jgi:muramidase (phage lysozyme)
LADSQNAVVTGTKAIRKIQTEAIRLFGGDGDKKSKFIKLALDGLLKQQVDSNKWLTKISKTKAGSFLTTLLGGVGSSGGGAGGLTKILGLLTRGGAGGGLVRMLLGGMGLGSLASMGGLALRAAPLIGGGLSVYSGVSGLAEKNETNPNAGFFEGGWDSRAADYGKSALGGAAIGATIGSIVPGVGTVVGAVVGGAVGTLGALYADNKKEIDAFIKEHKLIIMGLGSYIMKGPLGIVLYSLEKALDLLNISYEEKNRQSFNALSGASAGFDAGMSGMTGGGATSALAMTIGKGESRNNYNVYNGGEGNGYKHGQTDFSKMTVGQVMSRQNLASKDSNRIFAFGRYQMVPSTFKEGVQRVGANANTLVTPALQDEIMVKYLE